MANHSLLFVNDDHLILLPIEDTKENYLNGFWRWVGLLADDEYARAVDAIYWSDTARFTPGELREQITRFWGGPAPWTVVIPNERLIGVVNDYAQIATPSERQKAWLVAQIPVTNEPLRSKADDVLLQGVAVSFFLRRFEAKYALEFEIFHV